MKKSLIAAGAASVALAAMPVLGVFADDDPTPPANPSVQDTINVTVDPSCTFTANGTDVSYSVTGTNASGKVYPVNNSSHEHSFTVFCNNNAGYHVTAAATALNQTPSISANFAYVATLPTSGADGAWNATIAAGTGLESTDIDQLADGGASKTIVTLTNASAAGGETFTANYSAWIGTATPAGTYSGTITYTLVSGQ